MPEATTWVLEWRLSHFAAVQMSVRIVSTSCNQNRGCHCRLKAQTSRNLLFDVRRFCYVLKRKWMNALMTKFDIESAAVPGSSDWQGLSEIDQAIRDNRLMEYQIRKSWADPWGRKLTIIGVVAIGGVFAFLAGASFGLW